MKMNLPETWKELFYSTGSENYLLFSSVTTGVSPESDVVFGYYYAEIGADLVAKTGQLFLQAPPEVVSKNAEIHKVPQDWIINNGVPAEKFKEELAALTSKGVLGSYNTAFQLAFMTKVLNQVASTPFCLDVPQLYRAAKSRLALPEHIIASKGCLMNALNATYGRAPAMKKCIREISEVDTPPAGVLPVAFYCQALEGLWRATMESPLVVLPEPKQSKLRAP